MKSTESALDYKKCYREGEAAYWAGTQNFMLNPYEGNAGEAWHHGWSDALNDDRCKVTEGE